MISARGYRREYPLSDMQSASRATLCGIGRYPNDSLRTSTPCETSDKSRYCIFQLESSPQLLGDEEVNYIVPWSLAEIGDKRAVAPLIRTLADKNPSMRVLAIDALEELRAKEALPELHLLLNDNEKSNFGDLVSVAEAAKGAIAKLEAH